MKIMGAKLCEKRVERNGNTPQNSWIKGYLLKFVLHYALFPEKEWVIRCGVTLVTEKRRKLLLRVRARVRNP